MTTLAEQVPAEPSRCQPTFWRLLGWCQARWAHPRDRESAGTFCRHDGPQSVGTQRLEILVRLDNEQIERSYERS